MSDPINIWMALSQNAIDEYREYKQDPENYTGPMTEEIFENLSRMQDAAVVLELFNSWDTQGKTYKLFSSYYDLNRNGQQKLQDFLDGLEADWPTHFDLMAAWRWDGRQVGTQWELDENGDRTGNTTGTPLYPIPNYMYRFMPDVVEYDENGDEISRTPATSNADLRDINLLSGQEPRRFT